MPVNRSPILSATSCLFVPLHFTCSVYVCVCVCVCISDTAALSVPPDKKVSLEKGI